MKYYLWMDKVVKEVKNEIISSFYKLTMLSKATITADALNLKKYLYFIEKQLDTSVF
jgi:hypothetical protein